MKNIHWMIAPHDGMLEGLVGTVRCCTIYDNLGIGDMDAVVWINETEHKFSGTLVECLDFCNHIVNTGM